jgi:hypothetical protein
MFSTAFALTYGRNHLINPERDSNDCIKFPTYAPELFQSPLRDLALSSSHAACVDASGDVYQWGDSFFGSEHTESKRPQLTLQGKVRERARKTCTVLSNTI